MREALREAGVRGVLLTGWSGMTPTSDQMLFVAQAAPHGWLYPRAAAVVHHGGAGTTMAGLRAGRPSLICPFFGDQPYWGARVAALGAGPTPIPQRQLTAARLATALRAATTDAAMRARAEALGAVLRAEDGVGRAAAFLEQTAQGESAHHPIDAAHR